MDSDIRDARLAIPFLDNPRNFRMEEGRGIEPNEEKAPGAIPCNWETGVGIWTEPEASLSVQMGAGGLVTIT